MTDPIPGGVLTRMHSLKQATKWKAILREVRFFRAYCCAVDSDTIMGVAKEPVPVLTLTPNPVCFDGAKATVSWDLSASYAPGSTIPDPGGYSIDMGDGTQYFVKSGTHDYTAVGTYTVTGTVQEGGGRSQSVVIEVNVIDCEEGLLVAFAYAATDGSGVYYLDATAVGPSWEARNVGIEGTGALNVNSIELRPGDIDLPEFIHQLYAATDGGLFRTWNGGDNWEKIPLPDPSNAEFGDVPAATVDQLEFYKVVWSVEDPNILWVLAGKPSASRMWVYMTTNDGLTWTSRGVTM